MKHVLDPVTESTVSSRTLEDIGGKVGTEMHYSNTSDGHQYSQMRYSSRFILDLRAQLIFAVARLEMRPSERFAECEKMCVFVIRCRMKSQ